MTFDFDISETVSLSKILDSFLEDGEEPDVICTFLEQHETEFKDIIENSLQSTKIFQVWFLNRLSIHNKMFIYRMISRDNVDINLCTVLIWQIFQSNIDEMTKNMFRHVLNMKISPMRFKHPYRGFGNSIQRYDRLFCDVNVSIEVIADRLNSFDNDTFLDFLTCIDNSLWYGRMLQIDFFQCLDPIKQYLFCEHLKHNNTVFHFETIAKFCFQLLESQVDVRIKVEVFHHIKTIRFEHTCRMNDGEIRKILSESKSFPELKMKLDIIGIDFHAPYVIFNLLMDNRLEMLYEWMEYDRESMERNFNICDLLKHLKDERKR